VKKTSVTSGLRGVLAQRHHWVTAGLLVLALALLIPGITTLWRKNAATGTPASGALDVRDPAADPTAAQPAPETEVYAELEPGVFEPPAPGEGWAPSADPTAKELDDDPGTLNCIIEPSEVVDIRSAVEGRLEVIHVERSDTVEKGQVLVELDTSVELAAADVARTRAAMIGTIRSREANLLLTSSRRKRAQNLFEQQAVSLDIREEIDTEAEIARLEVQEARENKQLAELEHRQAMAVLNRRTLRSPISGVVIERLMSAGEVADEDTILRLAQVDPLRVEVVLPAARFGSVKQGMKAAVIPEFPGDQVHIAAVTIVDRVIDGASGTFGARLELPNPDHAIPGGLHCQVRFLAE
jgi:RND family efflux transporter MFP subunit